MPIRLEVEARSDGVVRAVGHQWRRADPRHAIADLFKPFSRAAVQPNQQGLGLGLYIAAEIARAHGGSMSVTSTAEETRFTLRMPARAPIPTAGALTAALVSAPHVSEKPINPGNLSDPLIE